MNKWGYFTATKYLIQKALGLLKNTLYSWVFARPLSSVEKLMLGWIAPSVVRSLIQQEATSCQGKGGGPCTRLKKTQRHVGVFISHLLMPARPSVRGRAVKSSAPNPSFSPPLHGCHAHPAALMRTASISISTDSFISRIQAVTLQSSLQKQMELPAFSCNPINMAELAAVTAATSISWTAALP